MWSSAWCQAQGGTPRRNASLAFRLERLQKFRYGVPPFQKVPVWRSGAFRLSLSKAKQRCVMGVGMCLYAQLGMQTNNTWCKCFRPIWLLFPTPVNSTLYCHYYQMVFGQLFVGCCADLGYRSHVTVCEAVDCCGICCGWS